MKPPALPVADLHCDLLDYLARESGRSPYDPASRCSIPQLRDGRVVLQVLAIFGVTGPGAARIGPAQSRIFADLIESGALVAAASPAEVPDLGDGKTGVVAAIENASVFCDEAEPLAAGLARFEEIERRVGRLLYVTLTWTDENRFGGGNASDRGLKADGRTFLEFLSGRKVALDFSHMSPRMAREALEWIDARRLDVPVCASHSCFAALRDLPRNLPDDVARELIARGGLIGMNVLSIFLGEGPEPFADQVRHAVELGGERHYAFGADFFTTEDLPPEHRAAHACFFHSGFEDAGCYPRLLADLAAQVPCSEELLLDLAHRNLFRFWERLGPKPSGWRAR